MPTKTQEKTEKNIDTAKYVPSSSDKKRAIMMYLFFGIMVSMSKKNLNNFEYYHLKQASGRWIIFLLILVFDVVLLFIPVIKYLGLLPLIVLLVALVISAKQARDGKYFVDKKDSPLALFSGVGGWFIDLFEISVTTPQMDSDSISDLPNQDQKNTTEEDSSKLDIELDLQDQFK
ncbi:MAG TPA: hypothetical protein VJ892_04995 [Candidatus Absconditabacterales bacterium]|nr:hypothetical protein [Candidatus Absconditabacterales bacterium]